MDDFFAKLGGEIVDVDEETFDLFSQCPSSQDLGMVDAAASLLELSVAGRDFEIAQSPGLLQSSRGGGTTGAAVWRSSVRLAEWLAWDRNPLFTTKALHSESTILELGSGISGLVPCILNSKVSKVIATDQAYVLKALRDNIAMNVTISSTSQKRKSSRTSDGNVKPAVNIDTVALDWENDDVTSVLSENNLKGGVDAVLACDCVYNYALIEPLVQTCAEICSVRSYSDEEPARSEKQTICVVAQQLRQPDVFEQWLQTFHRSFRVWRMPEELLSADLKAGSGFVVHIGILRLEVRR
ncbi:unnamed protein product [Zymoseptoria tritici ST99CH_1A5]|uniref:Diaminohydroxyphosphoribosylamino-pyrimidine deaminase n=2 Tax=Zymoseptoria tritici TaxID=1047171 RepID=F9XCD6_ZYMTI|nr:uncharacterized protein MYCGRDRAFT_93496 [Zymoseptoria tritici IPO323]EGP87325.1 hypothetical protein MYCGRDRAFT_93496 [Zymoseptoria tritici IPO323]SMR54767.1 unnamed protein product [Zymoseptoria tritici ST99CH_3D1]SMY24868.1 unnamed protein product [Zymoseptoria tritici ST99CH_1A5]